MKRIYIKSQLIVIVVFFIIASGVILFGDRGIQLIKSPTTFLDNKLMILLFVASLFEALTSLSTSVLMSRNVVPHYKAQSITALITVVILLLTLKYTKLGVTALIIVPFATQLVYQHWKWTLMVFKELNIKSSDYFEFVRNLRKNFGV